MECALGVRKCRGLACTYHEFVSSVERVGYDIHSIPLTEVRRQLSVYPPNRGGSVAVGSTLLRRVGRLQQSNFGGGDSKSVAESRLSRFLRLLDHLGTAPWANMHFDINHKILMRLTSAHLHLIAPGAGQSLCHIIDPREVLDGAQNLVWVTNRQQGKTTTLARFVAALSIACPLGGLLFTVYSTSLDRSVELVKAAKAYLYWLGTDAGASPEFNITIDRDNERMYTVNNGTASNIVIARPKNPDSCRGDAPRAAIFDEIGFIGRKLWDQFAFPLLQVGGRVFTCATTPPSPNSFFSTFIAQVKERNEKHSDYFFRLINHSLSCAACLESGDATECCHNLMFLPPWKSLVTLNQMLSLVSDKETYQMEVYGVLGGAGNEYLPAKLIQAALDRPAVTEVEAGPFVWVAIDPASHGSSDFAGIAFIMSDTGVHVVVGLFNVNMQRCQTTEVQLVLHQFMTRVRENKLVQPSTTVVPIIECNNNEILAMSMLRVFEQYGPVFVPWKIERFAVGISPGIGVWMTYENKMAALQCTYQAFLDGRVSFASILSVADRTAFAPRSPVTTAEELKAKLGKQLRSLQDQSDGSVSGKHLGNDDLASATLMGVYWSMCARASFMQSE